MPDTKHTPGNWVYDEDCGKTFMVYSEDAADDASVICARIKSEADAKLIKAAPALLKALQDLIAFGDADDRFAERWDGVVDRARAAAAEATA